MPLIDLQTDLKSLKYGRDRFNGGSSNQPYIQKSIPEELFPASPDFLLKEGSLERALTDGSRLIKFLTDSKSSQGALFVVKQELLSRQNPIVQGQPNRRSPGKGLYNPLNTLTQIGGGAIGLHVERQGALPLFNDRSKYFTAVKNLGGPNSNNSDANRLVLLYNKKIQGLDPRTVEGNAAFKAYKINDTSPTTLFSYAGGADEVGFTNIKIYDRTISEENLPNGVPLSTYQVGRGPFFGRGGLRVDQSGLNLTGVTSEYFTYDEINGELIGDPSFENIAKFTGINEEGGQLKPYGPLDDNSTLSTDTKDLDLKTYQTGLRNTGAINFTGSLGASKAQSLTDDEIGINSTDNQRIPGNLIGVTNVSESLTKPIGTRNPDLPDIFDNRTDKISGETVSQFPSYRTYSGDEVTNSNITNAPQDNIASQQLIKFFFELLNNDAAGSSEYVYFRAYLTDLADDFGADWQNVKYTGRAENFYQYKGFDRNITLSFVIHAPSPELLPSIYEKLNALAGMCAPDYSGLGYMRGNLVRVTIGDYIKSLPCAIKGFNIEGLLENGGWGIDEGSQTPRYLKIGAMGLIPIHDFVPERGANFFDLPEIPSWAL